MTSTDTAAGPSTATGSAIDHALRSVRMSGIFYCPSVLTEPWGLSIPPTPDCLWFHAVATGQCTIDLGDTTCELRAGDLVVLPHGTGHRAWGAEPAPTPSVLDLPQDEVNEHYARLTHGGGGARTDVVCGGIQFDHPAARYLIDALPRVILIEATDARRADWLTATLDLLADEARNQRAGNDAVISRLCDIVIIQAIRRWIEHDPGAHTGWLGALRDPQLGAALRAVHADPATNWTVARLAEAATMSRSAFAARFTALMGEPAMQYVTRWRMHTAVDLLRSSDLSVAAVAGNVGYDSEAAFSRAFKRVVGISPRDARLGRSPAP